MKYIGLIIAVFAALAAVFLVLKFSGKEEVVADPAPQPVQVGQAAAPEVKTANIYVAARDIPIGSQIDENMLTTQPWPEHLLLPGFVSTPEEGRKLIDMVARASFQADEPINTSKLVNPEDPNFLAGSLPKGMRVVTMQTDEIGGVAGRSQHSGDYRGHRARANARP